MANDCCFTMKVVAKNKDTIDRLKKIMNYDDNEYCMYRLRSDTNVYDEHEDGDYFVAMMDGDSAWSCDPLFHHGDNPDLHLKEYVKDEKGNLIDLGNDENGKWKGYKENDLPPHFTDLVYLSKKLDFGCELWCNEPGCCFAQHIGCDHNGNIFVDETGKYEYVYPTNDKGEPDYDADPTEECEFEDYMDFGYPDEIYGDEEYQGSMED